MEENGRSLTHVETKRCLKICVKSGTGSTRFKKSWEVLSEQTQPPAEDDFSPDVKGDILDFRPTSQQGNRWNLSDRKDQREILWLIRKERPKHAIGHGKYILFCTVLYHGQIRRGAWFLHDLSGRIAVLSSVHDTPGMQA